MKELAQKELLGLSRDVWAAFRRLASSTTLWAGVGALIAPHLCAVVGCNAIKAEHAIAVAGLYAVKEAAKWHGSQSSNAGSP